MVADIDGEEVGFLGGGGGGIENEVTVGGCHFGEDYVDGNLLCLKSRF